LLFFTVIADLIRNLLPTVIADLIRNLLPTVIADLIRNLAAGVFPHHCPLRTHTVRPYLSPSMRP
jgi:hypothetical protein